MTLNIWNFEHLSENENLNVVSEEEKKTKRSDIDARLLEVQAKILLNKAYQRLPPGHGKFNFNLMWVCIYYLITAIFFYFYTQND